VLGSIATHDVFDVSFSPDGRALALAEKRRLVIVDVANGARLLDLPLDIARSSKLGWLAGGKVAVVSSPVHLVRLADGAVLSMEVSDAPVAWTDGGAWSGTGEGVARLRYRVGGLAGPAKMLGARDVDAALHRDELLQEFLAGRP
jgi:hypothetical protein